MSSRNGGKVPNLAILASATSRPSNPIQNINEWQEPGSEDDGLKGRVWVFLIRYLPAAGSLDLTHRPISETLYQREQCFRISASSWWQTDHCSVEQGGADHLIQPSAGERQRLGVKPAAIDHSELPHEGQNGCVGKAHGITARTAVSGQALLKRARQLKTCGAVWCRFAVVTVRAFCTVKVMLKRDIIGGDQITVGTVQPACLPDHGVQALCA